MTRVGFIGLGDQGAPIARRIVDAGFPLSIWARRSAALAPFAGTAAETAASIAELGARSEHVGICVLDDSAVIDVCEALFPAMKRGGLVAIHSTVHPDTVVNLAARAAARGLTLLDAPVSGGAPAAAAGKLTVMVGGDEANLATARPVFATFASTIVRVGGVGAGQKTKLINNSLLAAHMAMAYHVLNAGSALGLDRATLSEVIKVSSGRSFGFEVYSRQPSLANFRHGGKLLAKDVRLLGEALGAHPAFGAFRDLAVPFLELMQDASKR